MRNQIKDIKTVISVSYDENAKTRKCKADFKFEDNTTENLAYSVSLVEEEGFLVELDKKTR